MAFEERTRPYEFLVRWGENGAIQGAHVALITEILKDGAVVSAQAGYAQPVSLAGEVGFPIAEVLDAVHVGALAALDLANQTIAELKQQALELARDTDAKVTTAENDLAQARSDAQSLSVRVAQLSAEIEKLKGGATTQGGGGPDPVKPS